MRHFVLVGCAIVLLGLFVGVGFAQDALVRETGTALTGTWEWTYQGFDRRGGPFTYVTTIEIASVAPDGTIYGATKVYLSSTGKEDRYPLETAKVSRVRHENGVWKVAIDYSGAVIYDLALVDPTNLRGSFRRPGWSTDGAHFKKK